MIILTPRLNQAIVKATDDLKFQDTLRRKFFTKELLKEAERELGICYRKLQALAPCDEKAEVSLRRLNIETHIEFLNREMVRHCDAVDQWIPRTNVETRKALNQLELDYNNNLF